MRNVMKQQIEITQLNECKTGRLTKKEVAAFYKVTVRTIENWRRLELIKSIKIGKTVRFRPEDLI